MFYSFGVTVGPRDLDFAEITSAIVSEFNGIGMAGPVELAFNPGHPIDRWPLHSFNLVATELAFAEVDFFDLRADEIGLWASISPGARTAQSVLLALLAATAIARHFESTIEDHSLVMQREFIVSVEDGAKFLEKARGLQFSGVSTLLPSTYPDE